VAKTLIDVDEELLAEAATAFGTTTKRDTVHEALRRSVEEARERRRAALQSLQQLVAEGGFNFDVLNELDK